MLEWIKEHKKYIATAVGVIGLFGYYLFSTVWSTEKENVDEGWESIEEPFQEVEETKEQGEQEILVDVKGAVHQPGVYKATVGDRVKDVIDKAGGVTDEANSSATNFAMRVTDEMVVYVPLIGEEGDEMELGFSGDGSDTANQKININKASSTELETLPGIGPAKAEAIIEYRESNGGFKTIEDIMSISGFGQKTFEKLQESITVN
ncbi:helix-hairpin-helix domain-containing protein [Robertmurraya massiliosenegalensis]|uniref:helix-hairpin-helix domain-containing protein n=1 Tax=Robertmurraya massiliosenegalensis TaxID=1287657 RepID=UPI0002F01424|nr:helix-hairpin-helix domain-containing protein [Robertmurraya massiliosenegalensis]